MPRRIVHIVEVDHSGNEEDVLKNTARFRAALKLHCGKDNVRFIESYVHEGEGGRLEPQVIHEPTLAQYKDDGSKRHVE